MVSLIPVFDLVGAVGFLVASALAVRFYLNRPLFRNYWLIWTVAVGHMALWSVAEFVEWVGMAPAFFDGLLQILLLTVGLTALLHIALYDNTGSETLLRRLKVGEERTSRLVDNFPGGAVVLFDDRLRILMAGGDDLLGLGTPADLVGPGVPADGITGDRIGTVLPEELAAELEPRLRAALDGETTSFELDRDDATYRVRTIPVDADRPEEREGMLVVEDVTERKRRERTLREQRDELAALDRINRVVRDVDRALVGADSRDEIARAVAHRLAADDPYRSVLVASLEGDRRLVPSAWGGDGGDGTATTFPADVGPAATAVETGETQVVGDVDDVADPWRQSARDQGASALAVVPVRYEDRVFGVIAVYADRPDAFDDRELAVLDGFGETVGYAVTAIERRERADVLTALHRATRDLLHAETPRAVGDVVVEAGTNLLDVEIAVLRYDEDDHALRPVTASEGMLDCDCESPAFGGDRGSVAWRTFTSGEQRVFDDVRTAGSLADHDTDARSAMFVPLGEHGVLAAGTTRTGAFDDPSRQLVELLAATTEAAFDRLDSEADLREREAQLREQNRDLRRLQRVNDIIRDVDQALVSATSRAGIEGSVCERLTADDRFGFAWICDAGTDDGRPSPRAWAGDGAAYLDAIAFDPDGDFPEPAARTLATGEPTVVTNLADHVRQSDWVARALDHGFTSAVSVPIVYRDIEYGALTVYASRPDEFDEGTTDVLSELAETVAYAIDARETKRGLLATDGTELELVIRGSPSFLNEAARLVDGRVQVVETRPGPGDTTEVYFLAEDATADEMDDCRENFVSVEDVEAVSDRDDDRVFRATVSGPTLSDDVVESGAIPREIEATADETTVVVSVPPHVDAREFVDRLGERYRDVELVARRERGTPTLSRGAFLDEFETLVTDRQLEVLHEAYESGYFESPRESTGGDVADRLDVSQPTVNYHLRVSQRRLLSLVFGERETDTTRSDETTRNDG